VSLSGLPSSDGTSAVLTWSPADAMLDVDAEIVYAPVGAG